MNIILPNILSHFVRCYFTSLYQPGIPVINLISYNKLVGMQTIDHLAMENKIDTVYVRYADEDEDRMFDCLKPSDMLDLSNIITERSQSVVGWRVHHNHREEKNFALAKSMSIMTSDEEEEE